jgi:hypothetical protein
MNATMSTFPGAVKRIKLQVSAYRGGPAYAVEKQYIDVKFVALRGRENPDTFVWDCLLCDSFWHRCIVSDPEVHSRIHIKAYEAAIMLSASVGGINLG